jgi:Domain of unknown function (DUF4421)
MARIVIFSAFFLSLHWSAKAQLYPKPDHDSTYYVSYRGSIMTRVFFSRTYNQFKLDPPGHLPAMSYHANNPLNLGIGATYKFVSFSISKGLNFLQSNSKKGKTRSFDLQTHIYKRKWAIDAIAEFYKGYYLTPAGLGAGQLQPYYVRPDMQVQTVGISAYRVLNDQRFSYGAALAQNAAQLKSAGSFLIGGQVFYMAIHGDSTFVPPLVDSLYAARNIHKIHLVEFGPGAGYAYTFVFQKHYFLLGSVNANINFRISKEIGSGASGTRIDFSPTTILRFGAGYNASRSNISLVWFNSTGSARGNASDYHYPLRTGSYRLVYVRRFAINHHMQRILDQDPK